MKYFKVQLDDLDFNCLHGFLPFHFPLPNLVLVEQAMFNLHAFSMHYSYFFQNLNQAVEKFSLLRSQ